MAHVIRLAETGVTRRHHLAATMAGAALLTFAACVPGRESASGDARGRTVAPARIILGDNRTPEIEGTLNAALPVFKSKFPNIEVSSELAPGGTLDMAAKFLAAWSAGTGPDVFYSWDYVFWNYAAKGLVANINDFTRDLKKADIEDFCPWQWEGFQIPNTKFRFGMPKVVNVGVIFVNKTMLAQAGQGMPASTWTREDYVNLMRRFASPRGSGTGGDKPVYGGRVNYAALLRYQPHLWAYGGSFVDPKDISKATYHLPAAMQGWEWIWNRMFQDNTWVQEAQEKSEGWSSPADVTGLVQGRLATSETGMHALRGITAQMTTEWDILPFPRGSVRRASWGTAEGTGISKATQSRDAAWELTKFLAGPEFLRIQSRERLSIPPRISLFTDWMKVLRERYPALEKVNLKVALDTIASKESVGVTQQLPCYQEQMDAFQPILNAVFRTGEKTPAHLRDTVAQVERAGSSCGARFG